MSTHKFIRNFAIIAHIDHGKSTLADRIIERCSDRRSKQNQMLDSMDLERERGITIKSQTASLKYLAKDGFTYCLNLMDTPGHVDFGYEVSRYLASCEGALLLVDASSSIQAQTLANYRIAMEENLDIVPVINKIDLESADVDKCKREMEEIMSLDTSNAILCSAKNNIGIDEILESIVHRIKPPTGLAQDALSARIVDSWFDQFMGIVSLVRVYDGVLRKNDRFKVNSTSQVFQVLSAGIFTPEKVVTDELMSGQIGFVYAGIKDVHGIPVGDTINCPRNLNAKTIGVFTKAAPKIYAGIFPTDTKEFKKLRPALEKLSLSDSSLTFSSINSHTLGFGFKCGFLGILHLEIISERIRREYDIDIIVSPPSVTYKVNTLKGSFMIDSPSNMPPVAKVSSIEEPIALVNVISPLPYIGDVMKLCYDKLGVQQDVNYTSSGAVISYEMPMIEVIHTFADSLKSVTSGYASFEYVEKGYREENIGVLRVLINDEEIDSLSSFCRKSQAASQGKRIVEKLAKIITRAQFAIKIQASFNSHSNVVARSNVSAFRKNVTSKCYGGDRSRKMKLLEKQKKGKSRMKSIGRVSLPSSAFLDIFKN